MSVNLKTAFFDETGKRVSGYYDSILVSFNGNVSAKRNGREVYNKITEHGKLFCKEFYRSISICFENNYAVKVILEDGSENLITRDGELLLKKRDYKVISNMKKDLAIVSRNGVYNIVGRDGVVISKAWFEVVSFTESEDMWIVGAKNGKYNILRRDGTFVLKQWVDDHNEIKEILNKITV